MSARQTLGRGFEALIPKDLDPSILEEDKHRVQKLLIQDIYPNPSQPRREFDEQALSELAQSIKQHGVMQPIIVVKADRGYRIVAGERRWRAARLAQLKDMPAIVRSLKELEELEMALIENLQRVDLSPFEQALAVYHLQQQFNLTLEEVAKKLGKAPSTVSNLGRLLQLPSKARDALRSGAISEGHARAVLALRGDETKQEELLSCILNNKWTVRQAEEFVLAAKKGDKVIHKPKENELVKTLKAKLGTEVKIKHTAKGGQIIIPFKNADELDQISKSIGE